jgi:Domain of Unknown Function (DUF1080)
MSVPYQKQAFRVCPRCRAAMPLQMVVCFNCGYVIPSMHAGSAAARNQQPWAGNTTVNSQQPQWANSALRSNQQPWAGNGAVHNQPQPPSYRKPEDRSRDKKRAALIYFVSTLLAVFVLTFAGLRGAGISPATLAKVLMHTNPPRTITYSRPKGTPLFVDPLVNDSSGWNLQSSPKKYVVSLQGSALTLESDQHKLLWELLPGQRSYGDFTLVVNAGLTKGDQNNGYGIYIRGTANQNSDLATYYRFELYGDGSYAIFKGIVDNSGVSNAIKIAGYTLDPAIQKEGRVNQIMIIAKGASLSLIVNGHMVKTLSDASYRTGSIALFVSNLAEASAGAQAQFSQLAIYPA